MSSERYVWTEERIGRLEQALARHRDDVFARAFLDRLVRATTFDEKRRLIVEELLPVLQHHQSMVQFREGREMQTHLALRDIVQDFLHAERLVENVPTNEADTPEEEAERERLIRLFGQGKPASEIVIDDRGPR